MGVIVKIGGSVLRDAKGYKEAAKVVREHAEEEDVVAVVSAMKGVTDSLLRIVGREDWELQLRGLKERHLRVAEELEGDLLEIEGVFEELRSVLKAIELLKDYDAHVRDLVLSFGERLSSILLKHALRGEGLKAVNLMGGEAGIITDSNFGSARPIWDITLNEVRKRLLPLLEEKIIPVVTGFIGMTPDGRITTLGRGGSDFTATLLARALDFKEVILYTDVDGIKTADPRKFKDARTVPILSIEEAVELAHLGAKRFHPRTFEPILDSDVNVRITSLYDKRDSTLITHKHAGPPVKAVAMMNGLALLTVSSVSMVGYRGTAAKVMEALSKVGANIYAISQPVSETTITVAIKEELADDSSRAVKAAMESMGVKVHVNVNRGVTAVSVVGYGLRNPEYVSKLFSLIEGFPILMVSKGPLDYGVTIITPSERSLELGKVLHRWVLKEYEAGGN